MTQNSSAPKLALYPVYQFAEGTTLPSTGKYYVITSQGIYFRKETKVGSCFIKVDGIPWLQGAPDQTVDLNLPKVPGLIIGQALMFFRKVYEKYDSESYVTLLYSPTKGFQLWCPKQKVSHGSVNYDRTDQPPFAERQEDNWQMIGTIHSHCNFSAFHSGTDTHDESTFDGLHITLGHVNRDDFSMVSSVALNNQRQSIEPEGCCDGVVRIGNRTVSSSKRMTFGEAIHFNLDLSEEDQKQLAKDVEIIEAEWLPKVEKETYRKIGGFFPLGNRGKFDSDSEEKDEEYWGKWQGGAGWGYGFQP